MTLESTTGVNRTILLIEDDRDICEIVQLVLSEEGYETLTVPNGAEALRLLRAGEARPFVIMLDLMLPVMDAWQFRSEQLRDVALAPIPVVIFSANPKVWRHADMLGAAAVIRKPPNLNEILDVVGRFAEGGSTPPPAA
jgi:CheY-like chemotaxis protein